MLIGAETSAPFTAAIPNQSQLTQRPNCPGQWIVPPGSLFQLEIEFRPDDDDTVNRALIV